MGFKDILDKAKIKINATIDKGSSELKKMTNTKSVKIYSKPIFGGFVTKKAFYEDNFLLFPKEDFDAEEIGKNTIIGLNDDEEYYVITEVLENMVEKKLLDENGKEFVYECFEVKYSILNDEFTNEVDGLPFYELTDNQQEVLERIKIAIENKSLVAKDKKDFCLNLWQYFTECIQYRLKEHYIMLTFARIASEYVDDFAAELIKLFA